MSSRFITDYEDGVRDLNRRSAELRHRVADQRDKAPDPLRLAEVRNTYEHAYASLGARGAPQPITPKSAYSYRRRLAAGLQQFSPAWRDANLHDLGPDVMRVAEPQIIADARSAAADRTRGNSDGSLRTITRTGDGGHGVTEYAGTALAWMSRYMSPGRTVRKFQSPDGRAIRVNRRSI